MELRDRDRRAHGREDPEVHERTLFILATLLAMYLRVSDLVGRDNWEPTMGDFRRDTTGNWWFHVVGKGNKAAKIKCELWREYDGGDHPIIIGAVKNLILPTEAVTPMIYYKGKLGALPNFA